jgi:beta-glucosidase
LEQGTNVALGPAVDIVRTPLSGRAYETLGEDPLLTGDLAVADIRGIQSQHVIATVKHFAAHTEEANVNVNARVSDQALHEIYLPAFEAAIKRAHAGAVMCAYNGVNSYFSCENADLLTRTPRGMWRFTGFVMSDWGATHSTVQAANAGLDAEMPLPVFFGSPLKDAVLSGQVPMSRLDQMVGNILTSMFQHGLFDNPAPSMSSQRTTVVSTPEHRLLATRMSEAGSVLLKNDDHTLPLADAAGKKIAVIGYAGDAGATYAGVGSPNVLPTGTPISPLQGITARAAHAQVTYTNGPGGPLPVLPADHVTPTGGSGQGFTGTYYSTRDFTGTPLAVRNDPTIDFGVGQLGEYSLPVPGALSVRWQGTLNVPATGTYHFSLDDEGSAQLYVNGTKVIDATAGSQGASGVGAIDLVAGQPVSIQIDYLPFYVPSFNVLFSHIRLGGHTPADPDPIAQAAQAAANADVAVVFVNDKTSEGTDRTALALPGDQDALVSAVAAANPNTVVVLNTSSAVTMPWLPAVRSVLEVWYPGQMYGTAVASLLFGDVNPSGKLPVTFPADDTQGPWRVGAQQYPGDGTNVDYSEGILEGYRWYDTTSQKPLFPFGYGLSYATFSFSNMRVKRAGDGGLDVSVRIKNTGSVPGDEVAQVYLGAPSHQPAGVQFAPRSLAAFDRVSLNPGETTTITMHVARRSLSYWSTGTQRWILASGTRTVYVGDADALADLPQRASVTIPGDRNHPER